MECTSKLRIVYGDYTLGVHGEGFDYIFSYSQGGLESVVKNGYEWLYRCPKPTFWRALTDNDRGSKFHIKSGSWLAADMFIDCKEIEVITDGKSQGKPCAPDNNKYGGDVLAENIVVKFVYETVTNPRTTVDVIYSVENTGKITVSVSYKGVKGLPQLPVFGLRFIMPTLADKYMYEGLSGETYPDRMAGRILGMGDVLSLIEKAQATMDIDEYKEKEMASRLKKGKFDFEDYLESMSQMKKMGGLSSLLSMMPGMGGKMGDISSMVDDKQLARMEAIVLSMTKEERRNPKVLNPGRKHRIARGAGVDISEVNRFIKQFEQSQKMMKQLPGMMGGLGSKKGKFKYPF